VRSFLLAALTLLVSGSSGGCWYEEATAPRPPDPGGAVNIQLEGHAARSTVALAHLKIDPPVLDGASPVLTVSLTLGDAVGGVDVKSALASPGGALDLQLSAAGRNHFEVHLDGSGCVATAGTAHLSTDAMNLVGGTLTATGMTETGATCALTGQISGVPADR
jgi:hypothetical protein